MPDGIPYGMRKNGTVTTLKGKNQTLINYTTIQHNQLNMIVHFATHLSINKQDYVSMFFLKQYYMSMLLHMLHSYLFPNNITYQCYYICYTDIYSKTMLHINVIPLPKQLHINVLTYVTQLSAF